MTPEHLHLALNHLPVLGAGFALIPLLIGLVSGQRTTILAGLLIAFLSGWATPLVMETGEAAYELYEEGPVAAHLDPVVEESLEIHEHRAEKWSVALYANAVAATLGLVFLVAKPRWARAVSCAALLFCASALLAGIWIAQSGGLIRRPDFRAPPVAPLSISGEAHGERAERE
jgi:hypothetical protein